MLWRETTAGGPSVRRAAACAALAVAALVAPWPAAPPADAAGSPVAVEGLMRFGYAEDTPRRMAVDSVLHLGFVTTDFDGSQLHVYDLAKLRRIAVLRTELLGDTFAVDERHHRVFYRPRQAQFDCGATVLYVLDARRRTIAPRTVPCFSGTGFYARGLSYHAPSNKLYLIGAATAETIPLQATGLNAYHESTIIRQIDADTFALDWEVDASDQCRTNSNLATAPDPVVGRSADGVISYCYVGGQGRALFVPMRGDRPETLDGEPVVRVVPTLGRSTVPIVDQRSGRLLILEDKPPFGPAVWVFDPKHERFVGVVPSGVALEHGGVFYDYFRGFSERSGRLYILNRTGLVLADVRADPLPSGVSFDVLAGGVHNIFTGPIAVDSGLGRLFLPYPKRGGYVVVRDRVPLPPRSAPEQLDAGTADVPEVEGKTGRTFAGGASAFGMHVVNTGGFPRFVNNADPLCTADSATFTDRDEFGRCPADRAITPGNREYFVAQSTLESGSDAGTTAFASLTRSSSSDTATDSDVRAIGRCAADRAPTDAGKTISDACPNGDGSLLEPFTHGSQGSDGRGYPVPGALCVDFEGVKDSDASSYGTVGSASASCDAASYRAEAAATAGALRSADGSVVVTVASTASSVRSELTASGVRTIATAEAYGVVLATGSSRATIGGIIATATTQARGRRGTTLAGYDVSFTDVAMPGLTCARCDRSEVAAAINRAFGAQLRARVPSAHRIASPRGYQGIVAKDPGLLQSDRAVNDDDTVTVNALDLIVYNDSAPTNRDGSAGRSRLVVSLAGVQAESRYGIFVLPDATDGGFDGGSGGGSGGDGTLPPPADGSAGAPPAVDTPGSGPAAPPTTVAGTQWIARGFAFVRTRPGEFAMLAVLWSLLLAPVYLAARRRAFARAVDR